tara:strand:- start:4024 stop:5259 length:1236 start_codon:yes stop_codon:yes gene_type:complete
MSILNKKSREELLSLGQFFTKEREAKFMVNLIKNDGLVLEPSCGDGALLKHLGSNVVSIELDESVAPKNSIVMDFFDYDISNKFSTIIGNPPYVANNKILPSTRKKLLSYSSWSGKTNLFVLFIEKCLLHLKPGGELIFIVPSIFLKATSCRKLNLKLFAQGTITDMVLFGDVTPFGADAAPEHETCIFRYEKDNFERLTKMYSLDAKKTNIKFDFSKKYFVDDSGMSFFFKKETAVNELIKIGDYFEVKVGAVSGLDEFYIDEKRGNKDYVFSKTRITNNTRRMIEEHSPSPWLIQNKEKLIKRKIKNQWTEQDWWKWGRPQPKMKGRRFYVNAKTRIENPFFYNECKNYDGSVLAIFPKDDKMNLKNVIEVFNNIDWVTLSVKVGNRFIFKQKVIKNCYLTLDQLRNCY